MDQFAKDALRFGCLRGFKHFTTYLRGREELLLTILQTPAGSDVAARSSGATSRGATWMSSSPDGAESATPAKELLRKAQVIEGGPPPASPAVNESSAVANQAGGNIVYLIGGYAKYKQPYVWLRSNLNKEIANKDTKDVPLKLETTDTWKANPGAIHVWHIVAELVKSTLFPAPENPLAVDHTFFDSLPPDEQAIASGALAGFLQEIYVAVNDKGHSVVSELVLTDLRALLDRHFVMMKGIVG